MTAREKCVNIRNCRLCLKATLVSCTLFHIDSEWSRLIEYCVGLQVIDNSAPRVLCDDCVEKLNEYAKFKEQCHKSDTLWKSISKSKNCLKIIKPQIDKIKENPEFNEESVDGNYNDDIDTYEDDFMKTDDIEDSIVVKAEDEVKVETDSIGRDKLNYKKNKNNTKGKLNSEHCKKLKAEDAIILIVNEEEKLPSKKDFILQKFNIVGEEKRGSNKPKMTLLQCNKCGKQYKRVYIEKNCKVLLRHIKKCFELKKLNYENSEMEEKQRMSAIQVFYCGLCETEFPDCDLLKQHVKQHYSSNELDCKLCDFNGRDIADIIAHRHKHQPSSEVKQLVFCTECPQLFQNAMKLEFHIRSEHLKTKGGWCSVCNFTTKFYDTIRKHIKLHEGDKYVCDHCGKNFGYRSSLKAHIMDHSDERNFICDTCGRSFRRWSQLLAHIQRIHNAKPVVCTHCNKTFKSEVSLKEHMKVINREKKFVCNTCGKAYGLLCDLNSHMIWHRDERPFECELCGTSYKVKTQLKIHMRIHSGHKPFQCTHCDKAFTTSKQCKVHQAVHTGIRRYKCPYCERTFNVKKLMVNHCKSKHNKIYDRNKL